MAKPTRGRRWVPEATLPPSSKCMTWKDRQRTRIPCVDLDDNPFCVDRQMNEERHMMQFNRNPSIAQQTSADVPRTASFMIDNEKPFRDFARKKRDILVWSLRAGNATEDPRKTPAAMVAEFPTPRRRRRAQHQHELDVDTMPNLEPYRREVVAQQLTTFGHRPLSGSRMFNPSTMATSCGRAAGNSGSRDPRFKGARAGGRRKKQTASTVLPLGKRGSARASRLTAPMLKELLFGDASIADGLARDSSMLHWERTTAFAMTAPATGSHERNKHESFQSKTGGARGATTGSTSFVAFSDGEDVSSEASSARIWRSVDPSARGVRGNLDASWLSSSNRDANGKSRGGGRESTMEETALREIFSPDTPQWDGTPAPLPAPRDVRRAVSSLLEPDPDERLRDKLVKSRKLAAGIPVTASSIKYEKEREVMPVTAAGRWGPSPATPRTILAGEEMKRLVEAQRERDQVMARRVRQAELSVFYNKIAGSETRYHNALVEGLKRQGLRLPLRE